MVKQQPQGHLPLLYEYKRSVVMYENFACEKKTIYFL